MKRRILVTFGIAFAVVLIVSFTLPRPYLIGLPIGAGMFTWGYMSRHPGKGDQGHDSAS